MSTSTVSLKLSIRMALFISRSYDTKIGLTVSPIYVSTILACSVLINSIGLPVMSATALPFIVRYVVIREVAIL